ncbi:MAG: MFS transporter [Coleofasciculus sp. G3-WIS-01]|uniref:MFS transporter n=1 Tax=Coleofasciculus sp. G3-WIS-01 TaxID=3069528 RepID=UPI0033031C9A
MVESVGLVLGLTSWAAWIAQIPIEPRLDTVEDAALIFDGPQFFTTLVAGVVLAFAFQMLLTNLGVALGISFAGGGDSSSSSSDKKSSETMQGTIRKIGTALGLATLISVTLALFFACLFAVELSLLESPGLGAIVGLVIWATYFSLLVWVSSTTVGSLIGSVISTATSGFQALLGTATAVIGGNAVRKEMVHTAEAAAAAVRRELGSAIDPETIRENLEDYMQSIRPPELNLQKIRTELEDLLNDPNLQEIAGSDSLRDINRQTFIELVSSRSDLAPRDVNRIVDQLENVWKKTVNRLPSSQDAMAEFREYLQSATPDQLVSGEFTQKLDDLIAELRKRRKAQNPGPLAQAASTGLHSLMGLVMGRTDLSDFDVEKIVSQLKSVGSQVTEQVDKVSAQISGGSKDEVYSTVRADVENYLLNKYSWQMQQPTLEREFRDVLYDPEADPATVVQELEQLNRSDFADLLRQRGVFTEERIREISTWLDIIRLEALSVAIAARERAEAIARLAAMEQYLLSAPKEALTPEKIQLNIRDILGDPDADYEHLSNRLAQFDRPLFERLVEKRQDLTPIEQEAVIVELEKARDRVLDTARETQEALKAKVEAQWLKVQSILSNTGKDQLNPQAIEQELKLLLDEPQVGWLLLRKRAERFDRDTLVQLLSQRQDLSETQINQVLDQVEGTWTRVRRIPQKMVDTTKEQYDKTMSAIAQYLRNTGKPELNPDGIQRDLTKLLDNPQLGVRLITNRLASMDRDTVVQLLAQRDDLSEQEVNQIIDQVLSTVRDVVKAPRRWALRTQETVQDFQAAFADYLRSTGKEELNPEAIKRDVQLLLNEPGAGMSSLQERLSHFDRSTLVALLSQREDISEEDVNRIVDQIVNVRDQVLTQIRTVQYRIQSVIDGIFERIRNYFNNLERPELNYDGIKRDIQTLFDDPEAGFDALRDRLSHFDRDTLVAIISSRDDISEADANRMIDQIEQVRTRLLQRAERIQKQAQMRLEQVKYQAQRQAEETRKAAAIAAWWLFATALVSALASAGAGAIGVA